jgi:TPR repeat protein
MLFTGNLSVLRDLKRASEVASAGVALGCAHSKGVLSKFLIFGAKDVERGLVLARESAAAGSSFGQDMVGVCYQEGRGVGQDYVEAVLWYQHAAAQGHAGAQCSLGIMYQRGQGVTKDNKEAKRLLQLSAAQGYEYAQFVLGYRNVLK